MGESSFGTYFFLFLILLVVGGVFFVMKGDEISFLEKYHKDFFGVSGEKANVNIGVTPEEYSWCKQQNIQVGNSNEDFVSDEVIGWDNTNLCCARRVKGFDCAIQKSVELIYCYTANIGGSIEYVLINDFYVDNDYLNVYLENVDKESIPNKPCNDSIYPEQVKI